MNRRHLLAGFAALSAAPLFPRIAFASEGLPDAAGASNALGFDLFRAASAEPNLFVSPFSIASALAMTLAGARGRTEQQMRMVMHLQGSRRAVGEAFQTEIQSVRDRAKAEGYQLAVANQLFGEKTLRFEAPFLEHVAKHYGAPLEAVNFAGSHDAARKQINAWVTDKTNQRIKDLLLPTDVTRLTRLVLTNAIWFKGSWQKAFDPKLTRTGQFHLAGGKAPTDAEFMRQKSRFQVAQFREGSMIALPYGKGGARMLVVLPNENQPAGLMSGTIDAKTLSGWRDKLRHRTVDLKLPKFTVGSRFDLSKKLSDLGMTDAFKDAADFSGMSKADLRIDKVIHKTFVTVGEEGTEAAAATAVVMGRKGASQPQPPVTFHADRPFLYFIEDTRRDALLFAGRLDNPTR
ncbi:MAG: serpin B [Myxococcota bacterium]|jgi:serpin B